MGSRRSLDGLGRDLAPQGGNGYHHPSLAAGVAPAFTGPAETADPGAAAPWVPTAPARRRRWGRLTRMPWPLLAVLTAQAGLSLRLVWSNTAFQDEALYLWTGHLEITHLLYHTPVPQQLYLSGAPVIYPIIGAIADSYGGIAAARGLSLIFMLAATTLLYLTASRLFGWRAGVAAAAVFAALGPAQALGAYATFDAMAICLLALAAWATVRARGLAGELLLLAGGVAMALADATKYASLLWNPVIIGLAALTCSRSAPRGISRSLRLTVYTAAPLLAALTRPGGRAYLDSAMVTTIDRHLGDDVSTVASIAQLTSSLIGVVIILSLLAFAISFTDSVRTRLLLGLLSLATLLAPLHQAQIHVATSLPKHVAFGGWFGAIAAGYLLARAANVSRERGWRVPVAAAAIIAFTGVPQAGAYFQRWPTSARMVPVLRSLVHTAGCPCLAAQNEVAYYYLAPLLRPGEVANLFYFRYRDNQTRRVLIDLPAYQMAIHHHYFHVVEIDPSVNSALYPAVVTALATTPGYRLAANLPIPGWPHSRIELWQLEPRDQQPSP